MVFDLKVIILVAVVAAVVGAVVGYALAMAAQRRAGGGKSVAELAEEHEQYRDGVAEHFQTTAQLLHEMTDKYRDVYKHMAEGAQTLVTSESALPALEQLRGDLVGHHGQADDTDIVEPEDVTTEIDEPEVPDPIIEPSTSEPQAAPASAQDAPEDSGATAETTGDAQPHEEKAFFSDANEPEAAAPTVISESKASQGAEQKMESEKHETPQAARAG